MMSKQITVTYLLNEEGRKKSLLSGGNGKRIQCLKVDIDKKWLDLPTVVVDKDGECNIYIGFGGFTTSKNEDNIVVDYKIEKVALTNEPYIYNVKKVIDFNELMTEEKLYNFEYLRVNTLKEKKELIDKELEIELDKYEEEIKEKNRLKNEKKEKERLEKLQREKEIKELKEKEKQEDIEWITNLGSQHLRNTLELGYEYKRTYINERIEKELPGFEIDLKDNAKWKKKVSPSEEAIEELIKLRNKGYEAEIIWLTSPLGEYYYDFESCEALHISFRGCDLIKIL